MRALVALILLASPATAAPDSITIGGHDTLTIALIAEDEARVTYHNSDRKVSKDGTHTVQVNNISVSVTIDVTNLHGGSEHVFIEPHGDYVAIPPDGYVLDGNSFVSRIVLPMY